MVAPRNGIVGKLERLAYERHERDLKTPHGFIFKPEKGQTAVKWIEDYCHHYMGEWAGRPLVLEPWQRWIVESIFGWERMDGTRRFRKAWIEVPRKNGKTALASAVALYMLVADGEPGGLVVATATKRDQAKLLFDGAAAMVRASPELSQAVKWMRSNGGTLSCAHLQAKMTPLSSDHNTLAGLSPHGDFRDEVYAWNDPGLDAVLSTAMGARRQPLTFEITTAGVFDPESVGWQHHTQAVQVLEGTLEDDRLFAFIAAIDEEDDWRDPKIWEKANPNLGVSLKRDFLAEQVDEATKLTSKVNEVLQFHFNRWVAQQDRWLNVERWQEAEDPAFSEKQLEGQDCVAGLDLSLRNDPSALVLVFRRPDDGLDMTCRFWLPESTVEDEYRRGRTHWRRWAQEGWLSVVPGDTIRHSYIREEVEALKHRFNILEFGYDPAHANLLAGEMSDAGETMVEVRQGPATLSEASKLFEAVIYSRRARATGGPGGPNPIMRYMVGNAVCRTDTGGRIQPDKAKARGKIDGVSAAVTGLSRIVGSEATVHVGDLLQ